MKGIFVLQAAAYSTWVLPASREPQAARLQAMGGGMEKPYYELPGGLGLRALGGLGFPTGNQTCKLAHSSASLQV